MINYTIKKITQTAPPSPKSSFQLNSKPLTKLLSIENQETNLIFQFFKPASWSYRTKICALVALVIFIIILVIKVRLFRKSNLSDNISYNNE